MGEFSTLWPGVKVKKDIEGFPAIPIKAKFESYLEWGERLRHSPFAWREESTSG